MRSWLFVPGDSERKIAKAEAIPADVVILDLEDAVAPADKAQARKHVAAWLAGGRQAFVRVNARPTEWHADDLRMLLS